MLLNPFPSFMYVLYMSWAPWDIQLKAVHSKMQYKNMRQYCLHTNLRSLTNILIRTAWDFLDLSPSSTKIADSGTKI